jgi:hypothetical protein
MALLQTPTKPKLQDELNNLAGSISSILLKETVGTPDEASDSGTIALLLTTYSLETSIAAWNIKSLNPDTPLYVLEDVAFFIKQYDIFCFVEVAQNNENTLRKLADVIGVTYRFEMTGQTACFYRKISYQFSDSYKVSDLTHVPGLYCFTVKGIKPELKLHVLAVHLKAKTKKGEG